MPQPHHQRSFASRFNQKEWAFLCEDPKFVLAVQVNLKRAWILAVRRLAEFYSIHRFANSEMDKLRHRLLSVGMTEAQIAAHFANASNRSAIQQIVNDQEDDDGLEYSEA